MRKKTILIYPVVVFLFIIIQLFANPTYADIINIPDDQPTIQAGINTANNGDTVLVQPGTYVENISFNGKNITVGSLFLTTQDTTYISQTIIDGDSCSSVVTFENGEDSTAILTGFTITNGYGSEYPIITGGGITCINNSSPSLENLTITGNYTYPCGGGILCWGNSSPIITNVTIASNYACCGGGIYCNDSNPSLQNLTIKDNSSNGCGGGIFLDSSSPILENLIIKDNSSNRYGGGIYCRSNASLVNVTITGNSADIGGGFSCANCSPSLVNITITDNYANSGSGIYAYSSYNLSIINSILWNKTLPEISAGSFGNVTITYSDIQGGWEGEGNIDADPLFVYPENSDYHLSWTNYPIQDSTKSPCIDAGNPNPQYNDPDGTRNDMGAYFFDTSILHANFIANITQGLIPLTVEFTDFSTPQDSIISWEWDFDYDGVIDSYEQDPQWPYITPGIYTVSLTVYSENSKDTDTEIKEEYITVGLGTINIPNDYQTIQEGIDASVIGDTVLVQPGTYVEIINYNGKNITVASLFLTTQDTSYISQTIIDGNSYGSVVTFENGEDFTAILCGFTITNGQGSINYPNETGGGITCKNSSNPNLDNLEIINSFSNYNGGGIYCEGSNPTLENVLISNNHSNLNGGGINCYDSSPSLVNVTITSNSANDYGGGIHCNNNSNPDLVNCILWNDTPQEIYFYQDYISNTVTISYSDILGDSAGIVTNNNGVVNWLEGNIDADPLFVDPDNGNYHLSWINFPIQDSTMSPCIDAGDPNSPIDPDGTIADMGAYYFDQNNLCADFSADCISGIVPLSVQFSDQSTQGTGVIENWKWYFGDGDSSSVQNPTHTYQNHGIFTIELKIRDEYFYTDTFIKEDYIIAYPCIDLIWPGDTDYSGLVDENDIIPIGVYWRNEGPSRDPISFIWTGNDYPCDWSNPFASLADCNGDGEINITDIVAIGLNWDKTHSIVFESPVIISDVEQYRDNFVEIYNSLGESEIEIKIKNRIAETFDLPLVEIIKENKLFANYPNPFNIETVIKYNIANEGNVVLSIYNIKGQLVKNIVNQHNGIGKYSVKWDGKDVENKKISSGLYFYILKNNGKIINIKKMILLR